MALLCLHYQKEACPSEVIGIISQSINYIIGIKSKGHSKHYNSGLSMPRMFKWMVEQAAVRDGASASTYAVSLA